MVRLAHIPFGHQRACLQTACIDEYVDAAIRFYVGVLGMEEVERPDLRFPGAWLRSHGQEVHLLGIESTPPPKEQHFAFAVDAIWPWTLIDT